MTSRELVQATRCMSGCKVMTPPAKADPVGGYPDARLGPPRGTLGPSRPPSGRGPIEWTRADAPHISEVDYVKPMLLPCGVCEGWPMAAGPVSRLGFFEPWDKTGLRLSPHLAPSTSRRTTSARKSGRSRSRRKRIDTRTLSDTSNWETCTALPVERLETFEKR